MRQPVWARLLNKVQVSAETGCWLWTGTKLRQGYGRIYCSGDQKQQLAHRVAYVEFVGPIPDGLHVLHSCDVPGCVNPAHLRLGTNTDNVRDKVVRRRHRMHSQTTCKGGHELVPSVQPGRKRECLTCNAAKSERYRLKNIEARRAACRAYYYQHKERLNKARAERKRG